MTHAASNSSNRVEWMWKSNAHPWSESEPAEWSHYSDVENLIIEEAFSNKQPEAILDGYYINFENKVQISGNDKNKQRPVKRVKREDKHIRVERFMDAPIISNRLMGGEYGWVSLFVVEARRELGLRRKQLASKDQDLVPTLVEKAARGIIEEGKQLGKNHEAEKLADLLRAKKDKRMEEVWKCCAYLYSLESFLYKKLNETMRLIGDGEHQQIWRNKVRTLGPFGLLLWDDPINTRVKKNMTLYRGANLKPEQLAIYEAMAKHPEEYRSFQAFTSCSRSRVKAEKFGNTLFIINVLFAFMADISSLSQYEDEEEELMTPGVSFRVQSVQFDPLANKHLITLELLQRWSIKDKKEIQTTYTDEYDDLDLFIGNGGGDRRDTPLFDTYFTHFDRDGDRIDEE